MFQNMSLSTLATKGVSVNDESLVSKIIPGLPSDRYVGETAPHASIELIVSEKHVDLWLSSARENPRA